MNSQIFTIGYFVVIIALFYLVLFLPENKRKKKYAAMLNSLKVNDEIVTKGGIVGKVVNIYDDYVIVQSGPDKAKLKLVKSGIANITNQTEVK